MVHERIAQRNVRPMEPGLAGGYGESQPPSNLAVRQPLYVVEQDHVPLFYREAAEGLLQYKLVGGSRRSRVFHTNAVLWEIVYYELIVSFLFPYVQKQQVNRHSEQPESKFRFTSKSFYLPQHLHENV